jgi:hypothetical protein
MTQRVFIEASFKFQVVSFKREEEMNFGCWILNFNEEEDEVASGHWSMVIGEEDEEVASSSVISFAVDLSEKGPCLGGFFLSESFEALEEGWVGVVEPDSEGVG